MRWGPVSIVVRGCPGTIKINCCSVLLPETRSEMTSVFNWRLFVVTFLHIVFFYYCAASLVEELQVLNSLKLEHVCFGHNWALKHCDLFWQKTFVRLWLLCCLSNRRVHKSGWLAAMFFGADQGYRVVLVASSRHMPHPFDQPAKKLQGQIYEIIRLN